MHLWLTLTNLSAVAISFYLVSGLELKHYGLAGYHVLIALVPFIFGLVWLKKNKLSLKRETWNLVIKNLCVSLLSARLVLVIEIDSPVLSLLVKSGVYATLLTVFFLLIYSDPLSKKIRYKAKELSYNLITKRLKHL